MVDSNGAGAPNPKTRPLLCTLTGAAGVLVLLGTGVLTLGIAPIAAGVLGLVSAVQHWRRRRLSLRASWITASVAAAVVIALGLAISYFSISPEARAEARIAAQNVDPETLPEWAQRLQPAGQELQSQAELPVASRLLAGYFGILGWSLVALIMGVLLGSVGWSASLLIGHAATGRWPFTTRAVQMLLLLGALACAHAPGRKPEDLDSTTARTNAPGFVCEMPAETTTILERDGAILETWRLRLQDVATEALPDDSAFLTYRAAIERDGADIVRPVADPPIVRTQEDAAVWRNEHFNNDLVFSGAVGEIDPISCLDALLFARQASRFSQIEQPTEFLASVLRRESSAGLDLVVVFGAGSETFPPREVYGFEVVDRFLNEGWSYWYAIHNHTVQKNGDRLALGVPAPSTSDVQLYRSLAEEMGLESVRVTNGFYTFSASADELHAFRAR